MRDNYLMRSLMFVPAHNQKLLDSAVRREASDRYQMRCLFFFVIDEILAFIQKCFPPGFLS